MSVERRREQRPQARDRSVLALERRQLVLPGRLDILQIADNLGHGRATSKPAPLVGEPKLSPTVPIAFSLLLQSSPSTIFIGRD